MKLLISNIGNNIYKIRKEDILIVSKKDKEGFVISGLINPIYKNGCIKFGKNCYIDVPKQYQILDNKNINNFRNIDFEIRINVIENIDNSNNEMTISNVIYEISGVSDYHKLYLGSAPYLEITMVLKDLKIQHKEHIEGYKEMINQP